MRRMTRHGLTAVLIAMPMVALAPHRAAASCPVDRSIGENSEVTRVDPATRLSFINNRMDVGARRALAWNVTWGALYGASIVTQLAVSPTVSDEARIDLYVGAASASIGTIARLVNFPRVISERRRLRRFLRGRPDECLALREAERALARSARWERRNTHLAIHFAALSYSVGAGLLLALVFDRPMSGHRQMAIGAAVGQLMLVTTPTTTLNAISVYRRGRFGPSRSVPPSVS